MAPGQGKRTEVEEMLARGLNPREIATLLGISTQAVYKHIKTISAEKPQEAERAS